MTKVAQLISYSDLPLETRHEVSAYRALLFRWDFFVREILFTFGGLLIQLLQLGPAMQPTYVHT